MMPRNVSTGRKEPALRWAWKARYDGETEGWRFGGSLQPPRRLAGGRHLPHRARQSGSHVGLLQPNSVTLGRRFGGAYLLSRQIVHVPRGYGMPGPTTCQCIWGVTPGAAAFART